MERRCAFVEICHCTTLQHVRYAPYRNGGAAVSEEEAKSFWKTAFLLVHDHVDQIGELRAAVGAMVQTQSLQFSEGYNEKVRQLKEEDEPARRRTLEQLEIMLNQIQLT